MVRVAPTDNVTPHRSDANISKTPAPHRASKRASKLLTVSAAENVTEKLSYYSEQRKKAKDKLLSNITHLGVAIIVLVLPLYALPRFLPISHEGWY